MSLIWQEALIHTKLYFRERQAVFWGFVFPILLLILFCSVFGGTPERSTALVGGLICINTMSSALFGTGVVIVGAREQGILRRYKVAPVALHKITLGICLSRLISSAMTTILIVVLARLIYHIILPANLAAMILICAIGTLMFCALAFAVASVARSVAHANGIAQVLFMPMMFLSGATFPYEFLPGWMQKLGFLLPSTYYVSSLKRIMNSGASLSDNLTEILVMSVFTVFSIALSVRFFRWE
ncbi:MAG: type transport system permease protein [Blastocatellia bacterium]